MHIFNYMNPKLVVFLNTSTRDSTLHRLVHQVYKAGIIENEENLLQAITEREKVVSTGIGMGIAIPHAKLPSYDKFFIAIGILQKPVEWFALDDYPVRLVFMIGGPDDKQTEYLRILSNLTHAIKDEERRKKLLILQDPNAIIDLFKII